MLDACDDKRFAETFSQIDVNGMAVKSLGLQGAWGDICKKAQDVLARLEHSHHLADSAKLSLALQRAYSSLQAVE